MSAHYEAQSEALYFARELTTAAASGFLLPREIDLALELRASILRRLAGVAIGQDEVKS